MIIHMEYLSALCSDSGSNRKILGGTIKLGSFLVVTRNEAPVGSDQEDRTITLSNLATQISDTDPL